MLGIVIGLLSTSTAVAADVLHSGLYVTVVAGLILPAFGLQMRTLDRHSLRRAALGATWQCILGLVAVLAGLTVGITFAP